jgi:cation:H+ antiporter
VLSNVRQIALAAAARTGEAASSALAALWTFPAVLLSAFVIAWAAEVAQFFMSQGLALALLAWLQTLPEFAVEADIAWRGDVSNMTANFTGSLRLLVGLGWPMIFATAAWSHRRKTGAWLKEVTLEPQHSITVIGLLVPIAYFVFVWWKASLNLVDSLVLAVIYGLYLWILNRMPARDEEEADELDPVPRAVMGLRPGLRGAAIWGLFLGGGLLLLFVTHPFVGSLEGLALSVGISEYVFIQWVAPFLSEFPEFLSAFRWGKTIRQAPMAVMNLASSNINQWTMLVAMIPVVYSVSQGHVSQIPFDAHHREEILLTILQSLLGMVLLIDMKYTWIEAAVLFALWFVQFVVPSSRGVMLWVYGALILGGAVQVFVGARRLAAFRAFAHEWKSHSKAASA